MSGLYSYWSDRQDGHYSESHRHMTSDPRRQTSCMQATCQPHLHPQPQNHPRAKERPSELESRLELLQSQLNRLV